MVSAITGLSQFERRRFFIWHLTLMACGVLIDMYHLIAHGAGLLFVQLSSQLLNTHQPLISNAMIMPILARIILHSLWPNCQYRWMQANSWEIQLHLSSFSQTFLLKSLVLKLILLKLLSPGFSLLLSFYYTKTI